ncbi:hypothetical protein [Salinactinospora qingdaonensis]
MSLLLMMLVLLGALFVIGAGAALVAWIIRHIQSGSAAGHPLPSPQEETGVGGYTPLPEALATTHAQPAPQLPDQTLARVRELLARGNSAEAVRAVRADTGLDAHRAQEAVSRIRDGDSS